MFSPLSIDNEFTIFVHGRCIQSVESRAQKLHQEIQGVELDQYSALNDSERYLDKMDQLREIYVQHLQRIIEIIGKGEPSEHRECAKRIEVIFDDCRMELMRLNREKVATEKTAKKKTKSERMSDEDLCVPSFKGKPSQWLKFRKAFEENVLSNDSMDEKEKLRVLNQKTNGVLELQASGAESVEAVWKDMCDKYNTPAVNYHVDALFQQKNLTPKLENLTVLITNCEEHLQALSELGYPLNPLSEVIVGQVLKSKIPRNLQLRIDQLQRPNMWSKIVPVLRNLVESRKRQETDWPSMATDGCCFYCKGAHFVRFCEKFLKLPFNERYDLLITKKKICQNCLSLHHHILNCNVLLQCKYCAGRHNSILHPEDNDAEKLVLLNQNL